MIKSVFRPERTRFFNTHEDPPAQAPAPPATDKPKADVLTLTRDDLQKQIEQAVQGKAKEFETTQKDLMEEINLLRTRSTMSAEERKEHDKRVAELENKLLTTEELAAREREKLEKTTKEQQDLLSKERDHWSNLYHQERIIRGITDAAAQHGAVSPEQMVAMLSGATELVEKKDDDGNVSYEVMTAIRDKDKEGNPITLKMGVSKAIEHMSQQEQHYNLFKSAIKSGFNGQPPASGRGGEPTEDELAKNPRLWAEYSKKRRGFSK